MVRHELQVGKGEKGSLSVRFLPSLAACRQSGTMCTAHIRPCVTGTHVSCLQQGSAAV